MSHIAIVPARMGSKSILDKNLIRLPSNNNGKTLTRLAIQKALDAKIFSRVIVSSDYQKVDIGFDDLVGHAMTKVEYLRRPQELCQDDSLMMDVIKHAMEYAGDAYTYVWLLQPTSPFRDVEDFIKIRILIESGLYGSVISFKEVKEHPNRCYTIKEDDIHTAHPLRFVSFKNKQDLPDVYIRSGNYYVTKRDSIIETNTLENKPIYPYVVDRIKGINIDEEEDLVLAKHYLNYGTIKL